MVCVCGVGTGSVVRCVSRLYLNGSCVCQNRGNSSDTAGVLTSWSRLQEHVKMHFLVSAVCLLGSKKNTLGPCKKHYFMFFAPAVSMLFLAPGEGEEKVKVHDPPTNPNF